MYGSDGDDIPETEYILEYYSEIGISKKIPNKFALKTVIG